jgi:hypothetical protein
MVSRLLRIARLPAVILDAFGDPTEIRESWGLALLDSLDDAERRPRILRLAREIAACPRPPAHQVYTRLNSASLTASKTRSRVRDEVVKDASGKPLFRVRRLRNSIAILLPADQITDETLKEVRDTLSVVLHSREGSRSARDEGFGSRKAPADNTGFLGGRRSFEQLETAVLSR